MDKSFIKEMATCILDKVREMPDMWVSISFYEDSIDISMESKRHIQGDIKEDLD